LQLRAHRHAAGTLTARHLIKHHGSHLVLNDVSLKLTLGARVGIVGPNGVGKSTLLCTLAGLEPPDSG
jgi:ATP-binding cassette subfamily F protein uup